MASFSHPWSALAPVCYPSSPQRRRLITHSADPADRPQTRRIPRLGPRNRRQGHTAHGTRRRPYVPPPRPVLLLSPVQPTPASSPTTARPAPSSPPTRSKNPISSTKSAPAPPNSPSKPRKPSYKTSRASISIAVVRNRLAPIQGWGLRCSPIRIACARSWRRCGENFPLRSPCRQRSVCCRLKKRRRRSSRGSYGLA